MQWNDENIVVEPVREISVFTNSLDQIAIRQKADGQEFDRDPIISFPKIYAERIAQAILAEVKDDE
jgi:hypothetical protein